MMVFVCTSTICPRRERCAQHRRPTDASEYEHVKEFCPEFEFEPACPYFFEHHEKEND
jgi:hypothetical protein